MAKYQKRTEKVDAVQWFPGVEIPNVVEAQEGDSGAFLMLSEDRGIRVKPGEWIVTREDGRQELYSEAMFRRIFEPVSNESHTVGPKENR